MKLKHFVKLKNGDTFLIEKTLDQYFTGGVSFEIPKALINGDENFPVYNLKFTKPSILLEWDEATKQTEEEKRWEAIQKTFEEKYKELFEKMAKERKKKEEQGSESLDEILERMEAERSTKGKITREDFRDFPVPPIHPFDYPSYPKYPHPQQKPYIIGYYKDTKLNKNAE